jgi:hypothetical protein
MICICFIFTCFHWLWYSRTCPKPQPHLLLAGTGVHLGLLVVTPFTGVVVIDEVTHVCKRAVLWLSTNWKEDKCTYKYTMMGICFVCIPAMTSLKLLMILHGMVIWICIFGSYIKILGNMISFMIYCYRWL